jgi:hypothetical protein
MSYLIQTFALTTTPSVVVSADADVDRQIHLSPQSETVRVGFDGTDSVILRQAFGGTPHQITSFVLPAGKDLYAWTSTSTANLGVIATKIVE